MFYSQTTDHWEYWVMGAAVAEKCQSCYKRWRMINTRDVWGVWCMLDFKAVHAGSDNVLTYLVRFLEFVYKGLKY